MKAFSVLGLGFIVCAPISAQAQVVNPNPGLVTDDFRNQFDRGRNDGVRDRDRPDYDPAGIRLGGFILLPALDLEAFNSDNVLRETTSKDSGRGYVVRPRFSLRSNWSNHAVDFYGGVASTSYSDFSSENTTDLELGASGRLDIQRGSNVQGAIRYFDGQEERGTSGVPTNALEPVSYSMFSGSVGGTWEVSRLRLAARLDLGKYDYDDVRLLGGGLAEQDDRDRTNLDLTLRADFAQSPALAYFVQVGANKRDYASVAAPFIARDSSGYSAFAGTNFDISGTARGEVGIGYLNQSYDFTGYGDVAGFGYRAAIEWFPSRLLTIAATGSRTVDDSAILNSAGALNTGFGLQADYEFRRNIIVTGRATITNSDFDGVDRQDNRSVLSLSAAYLLNRSIAITLGVTRNNLESSGLQAGAEFAENRVGVKLTVRR